ncbi:oligopeptide/dipeptide ABC transporter ATP-binding protein [Halovulum sp. GXIMD14793]
MTKPLLSVRDLSVQFPIRRRGALPWTPPLVLRAVNEVSFDLVEGETLGVVGESGSGKSTLARAIIGMLSTASGTISWLGKDLTGLARARNQAHRSEVQMVFQDPLAALNPRMTVGEIIAEPLRTHEPGLSKAERQKRVAEMMSRVGLLPNLRNRYPHEFSGGQCQRIGIARALILKPKLVICDEPVSALDVSVQAQVINLLRDLQKDMGLSLIFIAHDLSVVRHISTRILVMYLGTVMEVAPSKTLTDTPRHPYTQALIASVPIPDPELERAKPRQIVEGDIPSPLNPPSGCVFRTRCPKAQPVCAEDKPIMAEAAADHMVACPFHD